MMFPLGLSVWRRQRDLLPFFWSSNGITSMFASVLGMALSIAFGIASTYMTGVACYGVCAIMIVASRVAQRSGEDDILAAAIAVAPSIAPTLAETGAGVAAGRLLETTAPPPSVAPLLPKV
jgi:hypothetical protein